MTLLETARLRLRRVRDDDLDALYDIDRRPEVMRYVGPGKARTREQVAASIARVKALYEDAPGYGVWPGVEKAGGALVGMFLLLPYPETGEVEVGYRLHPDHWGKGYATEGARALIDYAFKRLGLARVIAIAYPQNAVSIRVMQKAGMRDEGFIENRALGLKVAYHAIEKEAA